MKVMNQRFILFLRAGVFYREDTTISGSLSLPGADTAQANQGAPSGSLLANPKPICYTITHGKADTTKATETAHQILHRRVVRHGVREAFPR